MTDVHPAARPILLREWWHHHVAADVEHEDVLERINAEAGWSGRYAFMIVMSALIAMLGMLLPSPVVVIGAMLISPLMAPIIGLGFALATFDSTAIRRSALALAIGIVLAIASSAVLVLVSPLQNMTDEIVSRTRPNLFDLLVALFSALAGAYALIRGGAGTVVGVALATALMPPLGVIGFGIATANPSVISGAALLFFTNFMTIALTAAIVARLYSFGPRLSPKQTLVQSAVVIALFAALAVPLGLTLRQVAWEAVASRQAREVLAAQFGNTSRFGQIDIDYSTTPLAVTGSVFTPRAQPNADTEAAKTLTSLLRRPVTVAIEQYRVGLGQADTQASQAGLATKRDEAGRTAEMLATRLALAAGVDAEAVTIDADHHRATVRAAVLPGATLATYHALEERVAAISPEWQVALIPPSLPLVPVGVAKDAVDNAGQRAIADDGWAAARTGMPIAVEGSGDAADAIADALARAGAQVTREPGRKGRVSVHWSPPDAALTTN